MNLSRFSAGVIASTKTPKIMPTTARMVIPVNQDFAEISETRAHMKTTAATIMKHERCGCKRMMMSTTIHIVTGMMKSTPALTSAFERRVFGDLILPSLLSLAIVERYPANATIRATLMISEP